MLRDAERFVNIYVVPVFCASVALLVANGCLMVAECEHSACIQLHTVFLCGILGAIGCKRLPQPTKRKDLNMDISEFEKQVPPRAKRSRLEPFREQIYELKLKGYADGQIREWLLANGLEISRQSIQKFFKKHGVDGVNPSTFHQPSTTLSASAAPVVSSAPPVSPEAVDTSPADNSAGLDKKQQREKFAEKYVGDKTTPKNTIASRLINQEKK